MPLLRKAQPGSDSYGHVWATPNSLVEVTNEQAEDLLRIADAGFTVVNRPPDDDEHPVTEVEPGPAADASPAAPRKKAAAPAVKAAPVKAAPAAKPTA